MFENLLNLVKEHAGDAIVKNNAIPNEHNDTAIQTTATSIMDSLKGQVSGGNIADLAGLFKGNTGGASIGMMNNISGDVVKNLMSKLGIDNAAASGIASSLIPSVMNSLVKKTNDPNDSSFDLQGIIGSLGGNNSMISGVMDMLGGGKENATSGVGGILNTVKGLFGK
jgi:Bacterial protein of unknown function (DUF937)